MNVPLTPIRFLHYAREQYPGKTAVVCGEDRLTYGQFSDRVARLAGAIRAAFSSGHRKPFARTSRSRNRKGSRYRSLPPCFGRTEKLDCAKQML